MRKLLSILTLALALGFLASCTPPYRQTFNDRGKALGWTQKQTDAAFASADRTFWSREVGENKYVIVYGRIPLSKVREQLENVLKDFDQGLDPKNKDAKQYVDTFNLRKDLEHDEEVAQAIYDRVHAAEIQTEFKQKMGDIPGYGPEAEMARGYNIRKIYVAKSLADAFPFTSDQVEAARKNGTLKEIGSAAFDESIQYDRKDPNPKNPEDSNDFVWKSKSEKVELHEYKIVDIDKPLDNKGDYIEGYRVVDGKRESKPALKVFFPPDSSMALVLLDMDMEGEPGFGMPDVIEDLAGVDNVTDLVRNGSLIDSLYAKKEVKKARKEENLESKLFKIEIQPINGHVDEWQKSPDAEGWIVPFKYANEKGDNYNVRVHYKKPTFNPDQTQHSEYRQIEYIEKEFTRSGEQSEPSIGKVVEYYRPKKDFSGNVKAKVLFSEDTKKVQFEFEDGSIVDGFVTPHSNKFIEDEPYAKSYNEGQKRWWIEKSEGSKVFDKRKPVGQPKELTGEYDDSDVGDVMGQEPPSRAHDPNGDRKP